MGFYLNKKLSLTPTVLSLKQLISIMSATVEKVTNERDKGGHDPDLELYPNLSELDHGKCDKTEEATTAPAATADEPAQTAAPAAAASDDKPAAVEKKPAKKWCSIL